jgi:hypothetical protein
MIRFVKDWPVSLPRCRDYFAPVSIFVGGNLLQMRAPTGKAMPVVRDDVIRPLDVDGIRPISFNERIALSAAAVFQGQRNYHLKVVGTVTFPGDNLLQ